MLSFILSLYFIIIPNRVSSDTRNDTEAPCRHYQQLGCYEGEFDEGGADCSGYQACLKASMDLPDDVLCTGASSCAKARIKADGKIDCSGYKACFNAVYLISKKSSVQCHGQEACGEELRISAGGGSVFCDGFHSCKDGSIQSDETIFCDGTKACTNANMSAGM